MARPRLKGSTDQSVTLYIVDDTDGTPEQGVAYNTASIALWYRREGSGKSALSLVSLASTSAAHTDAGLIHIDDGVYRLDLPDAAVASGAGEVVVGGSIPDMVVLPVTIPLVDYNNQDAVRLGLTSLPNAAADAAGGLPISDAGGLDLDAILEDTGTTIPALIAADAAPTASAVAAAVWSEDLTTYTTADTAGLYLEEVFIDTNATLPNQIAVIDGIVDDILVDTQTTIPASLTTIDNEIAVIDAIVDDILEDTGTTIPATLTTIDNEIADVDTVVDAIKVVTDQMAFTTSNQLDVQVVSMATDSITASAAAADFIGASEIAASASTEIADLIAADWVAGDASPLAIVAAIKADAEWSNLADIDANIDLILEDTGTTIPATITTIDNEIAAIKTVVDDVETDTNELQTDWVNGGRLDLILDTAGTGGGLDAAGVRAAIGLASANLDTQLSTIDTVVASNATILTKVNSGLEEDTTGIYRWTTNSMELAPGGATNGANVNALLGETLTETVTGVLGQNFSAWIGAGGSSATSDINSKFFTETEIKQLRYQIGIDGVTSAPSSNTPALATSANQTTILSRLGAWSGSGVNTVLGAFKALLSKTATNPSDIGGTFDAGSDSVEAIRDQGDSAWTSGGGGSTTDWSSDEREQLRYRLGIDGTNSAPATGTPTLPVNVTEIEGSDATDQINAACDSAISDASLATSAGLSTSETNLTTLINLLNDLSSADVNAACDTAVTDGALATAASLTSVESGLTTLINGLNDVTTTEVATQVSGQLTAYGVATGTNVTDAVSTIQASITSGHTAHDAATAADLTATQTAITTAISALNDLSEAQVNTQCDSAISDASLATSAGLSTSETNLTTLINGLNDLSSADVNAACDTAVTDGALATAASLTTVNSGLTTLINGLNDISATDVGTQVDAELAAHGAATSTNVTDAVTALQASITSGHTTYDGATAADLTATQTAITNAISALNNLSEAQVNTQCDSAISDASLATSGGLTSTQTAITTAISALNDLSAAQVNTEVDSGIADAALSTAASLTAARTSIEGLVNGLQDASVTGIGTEVASQLASYGVSTATNVSDSQTAITFAIGNLDDVSSGEVTTAVTSALTSYDAATGTDVSTSTSTIQTAISGLSSGAITCTVTGVAQESGRVTLKRGNPSSLVFTVPAIAMDDVLLGIRDPAGNSMLKITGTIDSATQCTFNISASQAINLVDGDNHNLDVFEVDGYSSATGAYTDAKHLASSPVTVQSLYLRLEN